MNIKQIIKNNIAKFDYDVCDREKHQTNCANIHKNKTRFLYVDASVNSIDIAPKYKTVSESNSYSHEFSSDMYKYFYKNEIVYSKKSGNRKNNLYKRIDLKNET